VATEGKAIIILVGGRYWRLLDDGALTEVAPENLPGDAIVLDGSATPAEPSAEGVLAGSTSLASFFDRIERTGEELLPESGFDTRQTLDLTRQDLATAPSVGEVDPPPPLDPNASVTAVIDDNGDGFINRYEIPLVDLFGTSVELRDNQPLIITVTDAQGATLSFETSVGDNAWRLSGRDFSALAEGEVTVTATATDFYGNSVSGSDTSIIDTLADINNDFDYNGGTLLNAVEVTDVDMTGSTSEIGAGRTIRVEFADTAGATVTAETQLAADGSYDVDDIDLSGLADGTITVSLASDDLAGNQATNITTLEKDTRAQIDVLFAGDPPYGQDEVGAIRVTGTVTDVEAGQIVEVTVSDGGGNSQTVTAEVGADGTWLTDTLDVSSWDEGTLTAQADVTDVAGNDATDTTTATKDTLVTIDIDADVGAGTALDIDLLRAQQSVMVSGVTDAEAGQTVTLTFADADGTQQTFEAVVAGDGSWSTPVTVDALNGFQAWTLEAAVRDIAGNLATDTTPTLIAPQRAILSEQALDLFTTGYTVDSDVRISDYDTLAFAADQSALEAVTANGDNLSVVVAGDGQSLVATADGTDRLSAQINVDGTVSITLLGPVDQTLLTDVVRTSLAIEATQSDADGTSETVTSDVPVSIRDAGTFVVDDSYNAVEDVPTSGNLFTNDNLAEGPLRIISVDVEGSTYAVGRSAATVINTSKGELTIDADGNWWFTSSRNLDHQGPQQLAFTYSALDQDQDFDTGDVLIDIADGAAGVVPSGRVSATEPVYGSAPSVDVAFVVQAGSDDLDPATIAFGEGQEELLNVLSLESNGENLTYTVSGNTLTATADGNTVFEITLSAVNDGGNLQTTANLVQSLPLDHVAFEELNLPLVVVATDIDGTEANASSTLTIVDGANPSSVATGATLDEDDLITTAQATGTIDISIGSDQVADIGFQSDQAAQLTSGGEAVQFAVSGDGLTLTAYIDDPLDPVFEVVLDAEPATTADSTVNYTLTLSKALDQLDGAGDRLDPLEFTLAYDLTDGDGDIVAGDLNVTVNDSESADDITVSASLSEPPVSLDNPGLRSSDTLDLTLTARQDPLTDASFNLQEGQTVTDDGGNAITRGGQELTWAQESAATWVAVDGSGTTVLRLTLPDSIDIPSGATQTIPLAVEVLANIDHLSSDNLTLPVSMDFRDIDGSVTTAAVEIGIADGRNPFIAGIDTLSVDEDQLDSGNTTDTGQGTGLVGSDGLTGFDVTLDTALTSQGSAVSLAGSPTADGWWIAATAGGDEVFRLRLGVDGTTEFRLSRPLDHSAGDGENVLPVSFTVRGTDGDGDLSEPETLTVEVTDDVPSGADESLTLTEGSTRSINLLADGRDGADGATLTSVTYDGVNYPVGGTIVVIPLLDGGSVQYGTATISQDGQVVIETIPSLNASFLDSLDYEVTDSDGDVANDTLDLEIRDEQGSIDVSPLVTPEDTPLSLTVSANPGDLDDNESVTRLTFGQSGLQGGSLTLDGEALATDGSGNPYLSLADGTLDLADPATGEVVPAGNLVFTPALNTSDPTNSFVLDVTMTVSADSGTRTQSQDFDLSVTPVVDPPSWDGDSVFDYTMDEDGTPPDLDISASLFDTDGSEALNYRIEAISGELSLRSSNGAVSDGDMLTPAQLDALTLAVTDNYAGQQSFDVVAISEETATGESAEIRETVTVDVAPVADTPTLGTQNVYRLEDERIPLSDVLNGSVTDTDGSETLDFELTVPEDWMLVDGGGNEVGLVSDGVYRASADDVSNGTVFLKPKEDISSINGNFTIAVVAIATESAADGIDPSVEEARSAPRNVIVALEGVVDTPEVGPGPDNAWAFDPGTLTISATYDEDTLIPLNFDIGTSDDDNSEVFDVVLRGLPDGVTLVDSNGDPASLTVSGEFNGKPTYSLTPDELAALYVKVPPDYSGPLSFELQQFITEPDGDAGDYLLTVDVDVTPVVDSSDGLVAGSSGAEDAGIILNLQPDLADQDGSETVTNVTINSVPPGVDLLYQGAVIAVPADGLDLADFASARGTTFEALRNSGDLTVQGPEDSADDFSLAVTFEVTDTSESGDQTVAERTGTLDVDVTAIVDDSPEDGITRIETDPAILVSSDGSAVSLGGTALFTEADVDGSEYLDYITITLPEPDGWFITHPNGAINDGNGTWLIPANGLTSGSAVETAVDLLAGATLVSDHSTGGPVDVLVEARVIDTSEGDDADIIGDVIQVDFQAPGTAGTATAVDTIQDNLVEGLEGQTVDATGDLNTGAAGDGNDVVSYRIDAGDIPYGGRITGADVITRYGGDGTTPIEYLFTNASLADLAIVGLDEDFAGAFDLPVNKISTDPSGDTLVSQEQLAVEVGPVVDTVGSLSGYEILEDTLKRLTIDLDSLLADNSTVAAEGLESVTELRFVGPIDGSFLDPAGLLVADGDDLVLNDPSRVSDLFFVPPEHRHGAVSLNIELTIEDETTGLTSGNLDNPAVDVVPVQVDFDITAVTDAAPVTVTTQRGDEDSDIALTGLAVTDVDTDGSETLSMQMVGVPEGAVLFWDSGSGLVQLQQNGGDSVNGYTWTFTPDQLNDLILRPPRDFSGDMELTLRSISMEQSTLEVVTAEAAFLVGVDPVADPVANYADGADSVSVQEGEAITIDLNVRTQEVKNPDETLYVEVRIAEPAPSGLIGIRSPDGKVGLFRSEGGELVARVATGLTQIATVALLTSDNAFGNFDLAIEVGALDRAEVLGEDVTAEAAAGATVTNTVNIDIAPAPTPPEIELAGTRILAGDETIPLGISLDTINPAPGETSDVVITGLPSGVNLSAGTLNGSSWTVDSADLEGLSITNATAGASYTLRVEPRATLDGEIATGTVAALDIVVDTVSGSNTLNGTAASELLIGGDGEDTLTGGGNSDTFLFRSSDAGSIGSPVADTITDFSIAEADAINLSDLVAGAATGADMDTYVDLSETAGDTTFAIDTGSGVVQTIELTGVSRDDLYGGNSSGASDADVLQRMIDDQTLLTGG